MAQPPPAATTVARAIHTVQLALLETPACTEPQLLAAGALLSSPDYTDVVEERSIAGLCGYPRCPNPLVPSSLPSKSSPHFRIALREHRVYDLHDTYHYCSPDCLVASRAFAAALPDDRPALPHSSNLDHVLSLLGGHSSNTPPPKNLDSALSKLTIQEKSNPTGEVPFDQWIGPSAAIEGYVPQHHTNQGHNLKKPTRRFEVLEDDFTSSVIIGDGAGAVDVSEQIAKQLEDIVITEKKTRKHRVSKKNASGGVEFKSMVTVGDHVDTTPSSTSSKNKPRKKAARKEAEDAGQSGTTTGLKEGGRKSSLKTLGSSSAGSRSVKWADERVNEPLEEKMEGLRISESLKAEDDDSYLRRASAEACAAALVQAAEVVAAGESEAKDAVSDAGILILPPPPYDNDEDPEVGEDIFELDRGFVKWPAKPVLLDTDMFDVEDSWHDTPPEGFSLTLSSFGTMWTAVFGWVTCSSLAHIYGRDESAHEEFLLVNGNEYPDKIVLSDGKSSEIRQTLDGCICRTLPRLVLDLRLPTPVSTLEKAMGRLLDTMTFVDALPSLRTKQWHVIVLLFIEALSVNRLPALAPYVTNRDMLLHKVLNAAQISEDEYKSLRDILLPLGSLPQLSMQCGG